MLISQQLIVEKSFCVTTYLRGLDENPTQRDVCEAALLTRATFK